MPCHLWSTWCSPKVEHVAIFLAARRSKGWPEHQHTAQFKQKRLVSPSAQHRLSATRGPPPLPMQGLAPSPSLPRTWASAGRSPHCLSQMAAQCFRKKPWHLHLHKASQRQRQLPKDAHHSLDPHLHHVHAVDSCLALLRGESQDLWKKAQLPNPQWVTSKGVP